MLQTLAVAGDYTFTKITAETFTPGGANYTFASVPSLADDGTAFFTAVKTLDGINGTKGIFAGNGGPVRTVVDASGEFSTFGEIAVNGRGDVAFTATKDDGSSGVYWTDGTSFKTIADTHEYPNHAFKLPDINATDQVAFISYQTVTPISDLTIYRGDGGPLTLIANGVLGDGLPSINATGEVAYVAPSGNDYGIFVSDGSSERLLYDQAVGDPALIDDGTVAFLGAGLLLFKGNGGPREVVADVFGPLIRNFLGGVGNPCFANNGELAFTAVPNRSALPTIMTGPDPIADKVVAQGDMLFGLRANRIAFRSGLNENGQIAFRASLQLPENYVVVRADPVPEPSTWLLAVMALVSLGAWKALRS